MKKLISIFIALLSLFFGMSVTSAFYQLTIFPRTGYSWVGDPMPYYDGNKFQVFYLEDLRMAMLDFIHGVYLQQIISTTIKMKVLLFDILKMNLLKILH
ncbi:hypothetical protein [Pelosinus fermentans]|uniref:hypothetical protein n=1 Tax=Pelosinus fermentans TaxID=365349 RepID=UPI0002689612|nr:hypothetical protein [Pelosinus fermentans]